MRYSLLIGLLVFILGCTTTPPYESIIKDAAFREQVLANSEGKYVQLSKGFTYFEQANPRSQKGTVVLVHGFSVPSYIWRPTFESLKAKDYHVLMLDLYGRGNSSNPDLPQTDALRARQVLELMTSQKIDSAIVVGLSNGGRIVSKIAALQPDRVQGIIYVSSSSFETHPAQENKEVTAAEIAQYITTYSTKAKGQLEDFYTPEAFPNWPAQYEKLLLHKGFAKALLSTQKNLVTLDAIHQKIDSLAIPVVTIWGQYDQVVVYDDFKERLVQLLPQRKEYFIDKAAHLPQMENQTAFEAVFFPSIKAILN
jgi:pimeloyl-ACP methyl ester carboxylesterase